jgi:hypothetical protein
MDEVVRNPINIPGYTYRIGQAHAHQNPPWGVRENKEECQDVGEMEQSAKNANCIPLGISKNFHRAFLLFSGVEQLREKPFKKQLACINHNFF